MHKVCKVDLFIITTDLLFASASNASVFYLTMCVYTLWQNYRAVLLIPDIYQRKCVRELIDLILVRLGFSAVFVVQVCRWMDGWTCGVTVGAAAVCYDPQYSAEAR